MVTFSYITPYLQLRIYAIISFFICISAHAIILSADARRILFAGVRIRTHPYASVRIRTPPSNALPLSNSIFFFRLYALYSTTSDQLNIANEG